MMILFFLQNDLINNNITKDDQLYVCDIVEFVNEFRLFIENKKLAGIVESTNFIVSYDKAKSIDPPQNFINELLKINPYDFCVIDIGMMSNDKWAIVEIIPPFSLSSYNWEIGKYFDYCKNT